VKSKHRKIEGDFKMQIISLFDFEMLDFYANPESGNPCLSGRQAKSKIRKKINSP
jgi:hypothetical protein